MLQNTETNILKIKYFLEAKIPNHKEKDRKKERKKEKKKKKNIRRPSFSRLNREQCEHGRGHVVVVKLLLLPDSLHHNWRLIARTKHQIFSPKNKNMFDISFQ
jgi:hypothetical protein